MRTFLKIYSLTFQARHAQKRKVQINLERLRVSAEPLHSTFSASLKKARGNVKKSGRQFPIYKNAHQKAQVGGNVL